MWPTIGKGSVALAKSPFLDRSPYAFELHEYSSPYQIFPNCALGSPWVAVYQRIFEMLPLVVQHMEYIVHDYPPPRSSKVPSPQPICLRRCSSEPSCVLQAQPRDLIRPAIGRSRKLGLFLADDPTTGNQDDGVASREAYSSTRQHLQVEESTTAPEAAAFKPSHCIALRYTARHIRRWLGRLDDTRWGQITIQYTGGARPTYR